MNEHVSHWLSPEYHIDRTSGQLTASDLVRLAAVKRGIANFVRIATGKNVPVRFSSGEDSYTDGKCVTISANISGDTIDPIVGVALHEAAHVVFTDFTVPKDILNQGKTVFHIPAMIPESIFDMSSSCGHTRIQTALFIKDMWNWVEDRVIDEWMYRVCPGYRPYYTSMYDHFWNNEIISTGLQSSYRRDLTLPSYSFRVINLTNPKSDLDALPGLRDIWNDVDLSNINRIKSSSESLSLALRITETILREIRNGNEEPTLEPESPPMTSETTESGTSDEVTDTDDDQTNIPEEPDNHDGTPNGDETDPDDDSGTDEADGDDDDSGESAPDSSESGDDDEGDGDGNPVPDDTEESLSDEERHQLEKIIQRQLRFLDGDTEKSDLTRTEEQQLSVIEESGTRLALVGEGMSDRAVECIVIDNLTDSVISSGIFGMLRSTPDKITKDNHRAITDGIRLGKHLGKKLKLRSEERVIHSLRHDTGRVDRRILHELGFGNTSIFRRSEKESFPDAVIHVSVDSSYSMVVDSSEKWYSALRLAVSIAKACSMVEGVDVVISFRGSHVPSNRSRDTSVNVKPLVIIGYDSRKDPFTKIHRTFPHIAPISSTPEGLAFESIMDTFTFTTADRLSYFLNISDGMPWFISDDIQYQGRDAMDHTRKQVQAIKRKGINVLSYFIADDDDSASFWSDEEREEYMQGMSDLRDAFRYQWGHSALFINTDRVDEIARTINRVFLSDK
jgi:hypothetical protein